MISIALLNTVPFDHSALAAQLTPPALARIAAALQIQAQQHVAQYWPNASGAKVRTISDSSELQPTDSPAYIVPTLDDAPGAEAYHDDAGTDPDSFLALDTVSDVADVTTAQSHENCEIFGDPECNLWKTVPAELPAYPKGVIAGQQIALEISDPVQDRSYAIDLKDGGPVVMVSDFCLPAYFDTSMTGPTTYCEAAGLAPRIEPFQRSAGGYQLVRNADGSGETQAFGRISPAKLVKARHPKSRLARRGIKVQKPQEVALTMLDRAHELFEAAHEGLHALEKTSLTDLQKKILARAHDAIHAGHNELYDHLEATQAASTLIRTQLLAFGSLFAGAVLGHVLTLPKEPAKTSWTLPPHLKEQMLAALKEVAPILEAWLKKP